MGGDFSKRTSPGGSDGVGRGGGTRKRDPESGRKMRKRGIRFGINYILFTFLRLGEGHGGKGERLKGSSRGETWTEGLEGWKQFKMNPKGGPLGTKGKRGKKRGQVHFCVGRGSGV